MVRPHVAMVTMVAAAHLAAFESLQGIAQEKASIFAGLEPGGVAVYNADLDTTPILRDTARRHAARSLSFGETPPAHHRVQTVSVEDACTVAQGRAWRAPLLYKVMVPGRHFAVNAMGVLAVADALGLDRAVSVTALGQWRAGSGRGARERITLDAVETDLSVELIDDSYNANPASLGAALEVLAAARPAPGLGRIARGRRIAYLGDMLELGRTEAALHRAVADHPAMTDLARVHCVGPLMRHLWEALPVETRGRWTRTAAEMAEGVAQDLDAGDVVLVKGSLSVGLGRVVDAIRKMGQSPAGGDG
jgi:UDP-N-acetylmuramoyl-tripeptide--D-alanyl-D-alanine ligase